ncbi:hypothetical protein [Desulfitobacterium sp. AusDCA]|uniref:hypothetical protein n=1 Tax=Desulfitobacterium sp. AusDCA TaxID=3240383 RepID=UPI003DA7A30B
MNVQGLNIVNGLTNLSPDELREGQRLFVEIVSIDPSGKGTVNIKGNLLEAVLETMAQPGDKFWARVKEINAQQLVLAKEVNGPDTAGLLSWEESIAQNGKEINTGFSSLSQDLAQAINTARKMDWRTLLEDFTTEEAPASPIPSEPAARDLGAKLWQALSEQVAANPGLKALQGLPELALANLGTKLVQALSEQVAANPGLKALQGLSGQALANIGAKLLQALSERISDDSDLKTLQGTLQGLSEQTISNLDAKLLQSLTEQASADPSLKTLQGLSKQALASLSVKLLQGLSEQVAADPSLKIIQGLSEQGLAEVGMKILQSLAQQNEDIAAFANSPSPLSELPLQSLAEKLSAIIPSWSDLNGENGLPQIRNFLNHLGIGYERNLAEFLLSKNSPETELANLKDTVKAQLLEVLSGKGSNDLDNSVSSKFLGLLEKITGQQLYLSNLTPSYIYLSLPLKGNFSINDAKIAIQGDRRKKTLDSSHCRIGVCLETPALGEVGVDAYLCENSLSLRVLTTYPQELKLLLRELKAETVARFADLGLRLTGLDVVQLETNSEFKNFVSGEPQQGVDIYA